MREAMRSRIDRVLARLQRLLHCGNAATVDVGRFADRLGQGRERRAPIA